MDAVRHVVDGDLSFRPTWKEWAEKLSAGLRMELTNRVHAAGAVKREVRGPKRFRDVQRGRTTEGEQVLESDVEVGEVPTPVREVPGEERRREGVEAGGDRRVRGENVARPRGPQSRLKREAGRPHRATRPFQDRKRGVALVEVTGADLNAERFQKPPAAGSRGPALGRDVPPARPRRASR